MISRKLYVVLCICSILCSKKTLTQDLETIVITGNLSAQKLKETGRNILVINQDEIQRYPVNSLDELLKILPGIEVQQRGPQGAQSDIIIRGGTFQQVLVVIDGIRMNDPLTGHFNSYIPIHPNEIDRIEILKGSTSGVFGPDAVGGVINIITKQFQEKYINEKKQAQVKLSAGSYGMFNQSAYLRLQDKRQYISIGYQKLKAEGPQLRGTTGYFNNSNLVLSMGRKFNDQWSRISRGAIDSRSFNAQNFYTTFSSDTANEKVSSTWQQVIIKRKTEKSTLEILASAKQLLDIFNFSPAATPNRNKSGLYTFQLNHTQQLNDRNSITVGMQSIAKTIRSNDRGDHEHQHAGIFSIITHKLPAQFHLSESIRADWDKSYKWVLVPQINLAWAPSNITLRTSIGKSIRDADFTERYNNYNKILVKSGSIGNPMLEAEKAWNMELGMDLKLSKKLEVKSTVFRRVQQNLIDWTPTSYSSMPRKENLISNGTYALANNLGSVTTSGFEIDLVGGFVWSEKRKISFKRGVTYLNSITPTGTTPSFYISSHARWLLSNAVIIQRGNTYISYSSLYKSRMPQQANALGVSLTRKYLLHHVKVEQRLMQKKLGIYVQVENLTNIKYSDLLGSIMPGRWWSGGMSLSLQ